MQLLDKENQNLLEADDSVLYFCIFTSSEVKILIFFENVCIKVKRLGYKNTLNTYQAQRQLLDTEGIDYIVVIP